MIVSDLSARFSSGLKNLFWNVTPFRLFLTALLIVGYTGEAEEIRVTTYNAGLLTSTGFNLVPCTTERTLPQVDRILNSVNSVPAGEGFAILLQEVWTQYGFDSYEAAAKQKGLYMTPEKYEDVYYNGQIIITNLPVIKTTFQTFGDDDHAYRGIRSVYVKTEKGPLVIANVHTSYSDSSGFLPAHKKQFEVIGKFIDELPKNHQLILGGDFNAGPDMKYRQAKYDAAKTIWDEWILPVFSLRKFHSVGDMKQSTWNEETNTLVSSPARLVRLMNYYEYGMSAWDQNTARIDHIMAPDSLRANESGVSMIRGEPLAWTCTGRSNAEGLTPLSDHYAAYANFIL